jgi:WD40 repeat protein/tRNA A-37 threonylcarbamoyl transferase component Bud32
MSAPSPNPSSPQGPTAEPRTDCGKAGEPTNPHLAAAEYAGAFPAISGYEILQELGHGGMGVVYKARQVKANRMVALKMILSGRHTSQEARLRFQIEVEAVARLAHANIVRLYEVGEHDGLPFFSLEYCSSGSLKRKWAGQAQPPRQTAALVEQLARAVAVAHAQGLVHRDLKPDNVLLDDEGSPKIADFGLARRLDEDGEQTGTGAVMGTPAYMAPEQAQGHTREAGPGADIYSLGVLLYEALTGHPPFHGATMLQTLEMVCTQEPTPPRKLQLQVPHDLEVICLKCLRKEPGRRYATAGELADDLGRFLRHEPIRARPVSRAQRVWKWSRRRPAVAGLLAAVVLVAALGMSGIVWQWRISVAASERAVYASGVANQERNRAQTERAEARWQQYRASISAASSAFQLGNALGAREALESAPREYRDWEWSYFHGRLQNVLRMLHSHEAPVYGACSSPDGARLVSWSSDRTLRLWDCASWQQLATLRRQPGEVQCAVFTPDGSRFVSAAGSEIRAWDTRSGKLLRSWPCPQVTSSLAVTPDGLHLVSGETKSRSARVWDLSTGQLVTELAHPGAPGSIAVSPDGKRIAVVGGDTVRLWDAQSRTLLWSDQVEKVSIETIAFSPDSSRLATGCNYPDNTIRIYDVATGKLEFRAEGHQNRINAVRFSPDSSLLASASMDQTVRLWDVREGEALAVLRGHTSHVRDVSFNKDGSRLVSASSDGTLRLWDVKIKRVIAVLLGHTDRVNTTAFLPDGKLIWSASNDCSIGVWDVEQIEHGGVLRGHTGYVYDVAVDCDGKRIASAAWDGTVRLWDMKGRDRRALRTDTRLLLSIAFSPDGRRVAAGSRDGRLWLWDLERDRPPLQVRLPGMGADSVSFAPDGKRLAVALGNYYPKAPGGDPTVRLLDPATGKELAVLAGHTDNLMAVRFSPDGTFIASGGYDGTVRVWESNSTRLVTTLHGHAGTVHAVEWSAASDLLASASEDRTVRLWNTRTFELIAVLRHASMVYAVAFNRDGTRLATGCEDNTIRLWDMKKHEQVAELIGHTGYVHAVVFSPDGKRLISGSGDHTVRIWETESTTR